MPRLKRPRRSAPLSVALLLLAAGSAPLVHGAAATRPPDPRKGFGGGSAVCSEKKQLQQRASVNVRDYGAIGNGKKDATAAIQKALNAGAGKRVVVHAGTYRVRQLVITTPTTLALDFGATLLLAPGTNATLLRVRAAGAIVTGRGTLDGNRSQNSSGSGIRVSADCATIDNVRILNTRNYGIYAANVNGLHVSRASVTGTGDIGIFAEATSGALTNTVIEHSRVDRSTEGASIVEGGIKVHRSGGAVSGVRISRNIVVMPKGPQDQKAIAIETWGGVSGAGVQNNVTTGGSMGISLSRTTNGSVVGNAVSGMSLYGIELASSSSTSVSGNTVRCGGYTPKGIVLSNQDPANDTISGNVVEGCTSRGIQLNHGSNGAQLVGNRINQSQGYAIDVVSSRNVAIANNMVDGGGTAQKALLVNASSDMDVRGNTFSNMSQNGVLLYGAYPVVLDKITIVSNTFSRTNVAYGTQLSGGATLGTVVFEQNTIT
jgi:parallel beta-helix repeat protein